MRRPAPWQAAYAWTDYSYPWNTLITRWKFGQQPALASHFARWMLQDACIAAMVQAADVVVPIPMSKQRMHERGYNPAAQLAKHLHPNKHQLHSLIRAQHTAAQSGLTRAQRLRNLRNAFAIAPALLPSIAGKHVLLIDDVMTTGATLLTATQCLLRAGALQVQVLCMARTPSYL